MLKTEAINTIVFTSATTEDQPNIQYINPSNDFSLENILKIIGSKGILSVMVEGGALLIDSFINGKHWDEARVFTGNTEFHAGVRAPVIRNEAREKLLFRNNQLKIYQQTDL